MFFFDFVVSQFAHHVQSSSLVRAYLPNNRPRVPQKQVHNLVQMCRLRNPVRVKDQFTRDVTCEGTPRRLLEYL